MNITKLEGVCGLQLPSPGYGLVIEDYITWLHARYELQSQFSECYF